MARSVLVIQLADTSEPLLFHGPFFHVNFHCLCQGTLDQDSSIGSSWKKKTSGPSKMALTDFHLSSAGEHQD